MGRSCRADHGQRSTVHGGLVYGGRCFVERQQAIINKERLNCALKTAVDGRRTTVGSFASGDASGKDRRRWRCRKHWFLRWTGSGYKRSSSGNIKWNSLVVTIALPKQTFSCRKPNDAAGRAHDTVSDKQAICCALAGRHAHWKRPNRGPSTVDRGLPYNTLFLTPVDTVDTDLFSNQNSKCKKK
jgi:hypothetical protein